MILCRRSILAELSYCRAPSHPSAENILYLNGENRGIVNNLCFPATVASSYAPPGQVRRVYDNGSTTRLLLFTYHLVLAEHLGTLWASFVQLDIESFAIAAYPGLPLRNSISGKTHCWILIAVFKIYLPIVVRQAIQLVCL